MLVDEYSDANRYKELTNMKLFCKRDLMRFMSVKASVKMLNTLGAAGVDYIGKYSKVDGILIYHRYFPLELAEEHFKRVSKSWNPRFRKIAIDYLEILEKLK